MTSAIKSQIPTIGREVAWICYWQGKGVNLADVIYGWPLTRLIFEEHARGASYHEREVEACSKALNRRTAHMHSSGLLCSKEQRLDEFCIEVLFGIDSLTNFALTLGL